MATTTKTHSQFNTATKNIKSAVIHHPWKLLTSKQIPYDEMTYGHGFRTGTMPTTVRLYYPILRAVEMFTRKTPMPYPDAPDYLLVSDRVTVKDPNGKSIQKKNYFLELRWPDGSATIMSKDTAGNIRISEMETDGSDNPAGEFSDMDEFRLAGIWLLCLPEILDEDANTAGKLNSAVADFALLVDEFPSWTTEADIPQLAKDTAFYMDAAYCYAKDKAKWNFADPISTQYATATTAEQVTAVNMKGATVVCSNPNVNFQHVKSNGKSDNGSSQSMTIREARDKFSSFTAHRNWTPAEKLMIPHFEDSYPVMPEVVKIANAICGTRQGIDPICQVLWRGITGYGKSTGVRQLACILNIPLLIQTCSPNMEVGDFKSSFVPESGDDGLEVDAANIVLTQATEETPSPLLEKAIANLSKMDRTDRDAFLSGTAFFMEAMMDAESAACSLLGESVEAEVEDLCKLYTDCVVYFREKPLRVKLAQMEESAPEQDKEREKKDNSPAFKHTLSPYIKALINGYLIEVQEASRIRDAGVLVGLNEYDKAGAVIHLMNGAAARRHKDAIVIATDNVGYCSCRPLDPSVIRRYGFTVDSYELSEKMLKDRVRRNTGCKDEALLNRCFKLWQTVKEYTEQNSITEGSVSPVELTRFVQMVLLEGEDSLEENLDCCVISKASSSLDDQRDIRTACSLT